MKLYHFNPNTYAETYTVMAESREAAIDAVRRHMEQDAATSYAWIDDPEERALSRRGRLKDSLAELEQFVTGFKDGWQDKPYAIEVYEPGQVVQGEIS